MSASHAPLTLARLEDCARRAARTGLPCFSHFLDPVQSDLAERAARSQDVRARLWGGYAGAERRIAGFFARPDLTGDLEDAEDAPQAEWPLRWLHCRWDPRYAAPRHRDLLGAMLGQGITRENLGDFLLSEGQAYCAATPDIAGYLAGTLREAGRVTLRCEVLEDAPALPAPEQGAAARRGTVASLRLDSVLAEACDLSRTDALALIAQGLVRVDYRLVEKPDMRLEQGALLSVRGRGRFRLAEVGPATRKGRVGVVILRYP